MQKDMEVVIESERKGILPQRKKEGKKLVRLGDPGTSMRSDAPTLPSMIKHPLNLTNSFVDDFSVELVGGVCTGVGWLLPVSESATQMHLRPEEYACAPDVAGREVERCDFFHGSWQEARCVGYDFLVWY